ncbi:hypothetical protein ACLB2K_000831 [Fragaria x ananassa]
MRVQGACSSASFKNTNDTLMKKEENEISPASSCTSKLSKQPYNLIFIETIAFNGFNPIPTTHIIGVKVTVTPFHKEPRVTFLKEQNSQSKKRSLSQPSQTLTITTNRRISSYLAAVIGGTYYLVATSSFHYIPGYYITGMLKVAASLREWAHFLSIIEMVLKLDSDDVGWEFGELVSLGNKDKVRCRLCGKIVSGITRLKKHVANISGVAAPCTMSSKEDREKSKKGIKKKSIKKPKKKPSYDVENRIKKLEDDVKKLERIVEQQRGVIHNLKAKVRRLEMREEEGEGEDGEEGHSEDTDEDREEEEEPTMKTRKRKQIGGKNNEEEEDHPPEQEEEEEKEEEDQPPEQVVEEGHPPEQQVEEDQPPEQVEEDQPPEQVAAILGSPQQSPIVWPLDGKLSVEWVQNLMAMFDWSSRNLTPAEFSKVLPVQVFDSLVVTASKILHKEPNCVKIDNRCPDSTIVVVGDVHGQLHDVLFLLKDSGYPLENRIFVFNGDYVDRGAWGLETLLILLAWKVLMPKSVYLLRGNHESKYCTSVFGFEKEVLVKYKDNGKQVYRKCLDCFKELPLASIINEQVYTAHGGLFRKPGKPSKRAKGKKKQKIVSNSETSSLVLGSLDELSKAGRSVLDPPLEGSNLIPGDVLWSDPSTKPGLSLNEDRGIGMFWGPDCTEDFLKKFQLKLIIRLHEGPDARDKRPGLEGMDQGYTIDHVVESGKRITLFSAPDYPQFQVTQKRYKKNKGAYIVLEPPNFDDPVFHSFEAVSPRPQVEAYYDYIEAIDSDEELDMDKMTSSS